jgi:HSP90 family molecular chaperone
MPQATFKIDTRLATLLSENYRSSELALKELIDNAWDADADDVSIFLPEPMSGGAIVISDNGSGMTETELTVEYLNVASNRRTRRGDLTAVKKRKVKGRKGIGKFAGFMAANCMKLETWARGLRSEFTLDKKALESHAHLSEMPLDVLSEADESIGKGTKITLSELHTHIAYPNPERLRQLLIQEYGREHDFNIFINGKDLDIDDPHRQHRTVN